MAETFGSCLRAWMKTNGMSAASLAERLGLHSKTTVLRMTRDETSHQARRHFAATLAVCFPPDEPWRARFEQALRVSGLGAVPSGILDALDGAVFGPVPQARERAGDRVFREVHVFGWTDRDRVPSLLGRLREDGILVHYFLRGELASREELMGSVIRHLGDSRYRAVALEDNVPGMPWNILVADTGSGQRIAFPEETQGDGYDVSPAFCGALLEMTAAAGGRKLYQNDDLRTASDFVRFQKESYEMEKKRRTIIVKPTPGVQMLPAGMIVNLFRETGHQDAASMITSSDALIYFYKQRADNFAGNPEEITLILSPGGMRTFMKTGRLADHPFMLRPFTQEERRQVIRYLLHLTEKPGFQLLMLREGQASAYSFEVYADCAALVYPSRTDYSAESGSYREAVFRGKNETALFEAFVREVVVPERCQSREATRETLLEMIGMHDRSEWNTEAVMATKEGKDGDL